MEKKVPDFLAAGDENELLSDPEVREAVIEITARVQSIPHGLLEKGLDKPHWWMTYGSWPEFLQKERIAESFLNVLALLHFKIPLHELTQRVTDGDSGVSAKLFRFEGRSPEGLYAGSQKVLENITDRATKIVGRALLFKEEPPGHQLHLRMVLFFGWDFGLSDLSTRELHAFLTEMQIIPSWYDPETLRKYRSRLLRLITREPKRLLPNFSSSTSQ